MKKNVAALVLAAGLGTRMKSSRAKVLHEVLFKPMILHVLDAVKDLKLDYTYVIVGHQREKVAALVSGCEARCIIQEEQLGTGHAVLCAEQELSSNSNTVLILSGDVPLIRADTLRALLAAHADKLSPLTIMTATLNDPENYGRIVRDRNDKLLEIIEEKDATPAQKKIREINAGIYCAEVSFLFEALKKVGSDNKQGEIYLTDIVKIAIGMGLAVDVFAGGSGEELLGINSRIELARANKYLQRRKNQQLMTDGISLADPESVFIQPEVQIGRDTMIHANVQISGNSVIGSNCTIGPDVVLHDCRVGENVCLEPFSNLASCRVPDNATVGPHTSLCRE